jgi:hypothetical protein
MLWINRISLREALTHYPLDQSHFPAGRLDALAMRSISLREIERIAKGWGFSPATHLDVHDRES